MEVNPSSEPLGPAPGRIIANPQARFVGPQKSQVPLPTQKPLQGGKKGTGKIGGKELAYPSKFLKGKGKATSKLKGPLARKAKQLKKKRK